jgi:two-component system cell cycle response regulator DivK
MVFLYIYAEMSNRFYMSPPNLENKKILVVEDDDMSFLYLNQLLMLTRGTLIREKSGIDAIEQFRNNPGYDLVLMDIQLPDMDGKQVTREIRNMDRNVPIIAQTASRSGQEKELALNAGCTALITKPFSMDQLFEIIDQHVPR